MSVPAAKVKAICTSSEAALVRSSRRPAIGELTQTRLQQYAIRARKLAEKWEGQVREQSRDRRRQSGTSDVDANTRLKAEIFREALNAFEASLKSVGSKPMTVKRPTNANRGRSAAHRTTRAAVRQELTSTKLERNQQRSKKAKPAASKVPAKPDVAKPAPPATTEAQPATTAAKPATKPVKSKLKGKPVVAVGANIATTKVSRGKQLAAKAAAKQARVGKSGAVTHALRHQVARGKRVQARRDARGSATTT